LFSPGEFGPVFATEAVDGPSWNEINDKRYAALGEQMKVYNQDRISWTIWLYKDIGIQGMVHAKQDSPWIKLFGKAIARKRKLALEFWGTDEWVDWGFRWNVWMANCASCFHASQYRDN
jgi:endoglucanase